MTQTILSPNLISDIKEMKAEIERLKRAQNASKAREDDLFKPKDIYGSGVPAAQGGVAPSVSLGERPMSGNVELYCNVLGDLRMTITPTVNVWWRTFYQDIAYPTDAAWCRADFYMDLAAGPQATDARGKTFSATYILAGHGSVAWQTFQLDSLWKLEAGKSYSVRPVVFVRTGTGWRYYLHGEFLMGSSMIVGYW